MNLESKDSYSTPNRQKMSSSLRERLKKQGRFHVISPRTPITPPADSTGLLSASTDSLPGTPVRFPENKTSPWLTPAMDGHRSTSGHLSTPAANSLVGHRPTKLFPVQSPRSNVCSSTISTTKSTDEFGQWQAKVKAKEEIVRKLRMVKLYRSKNDLNQLSVLTGKWRTACRQAVLDLMDLMTDPKPRLTELIDQLGFRHRIIGYDAENECFDDE